MANHPAGRDFRSFSRTLFRVREKDFPLRSIAFLRTFFSSAEFPPRKWNRKWNRGRKDVGSLSPDGRTKKGQTSFFFTKGPFLSYFHFEFLKDAVGVPGWTRIGKRPAEDQEKAECENVGIWAKELSGRRMKSAENSESEMVKVKCCINLLFESEFCTLSIAALSRFCGWVIGAGLFYAERTKSGCLGFDFDLLRPSAI